MLMQTKQLNTNTVTLHRYLPHMHPQNISHCFSLQIMVICDTRNLIHLNPTIQQQIPNNNIKASSYRSFLMLLVEDLLCPELLCVSISLCCTYLLQVSMAYAERIMSSLVLFETYPTPGFTYTVATIKEAFTAASSTCAKASNPGHCPIAVETVLSLGGKHPLDFTPFSPNVIPCRE